MCFRPVSYKKAKDGPALEYLKNIPTFTGRPLDPTSWHKNINKDIII